MALSTRTMVYAAGAAVVLTGAILLTVFRDEQESAKPEKSTASLPTRSSRPAASRAESSAPIKKGRRYFPDRTDAEWKRAASTLTPAQAKAMLERDKLEEKNIDARAERAWQIINQLCLNGHAREAWDLIETEPGGVREKGLGGFFRDADLPAGEMIAMMNELQNRERSSAYYNYWSRFTPEEFTKMDLSAFTMRNPIEFGAYRRAMEDMLTDSYDEKNPEASKWVRHDLLAMALKQSIDGGMNYAEFKAFLAKDPSKDGFTYWEVLKGATPEIRADQLMGSRNYDGTDSMVIRAMAIQDPTKTMEMTLIPGTHEANYIHIAMGQWLEKDFGNAKTWVDGRYATFTPEQQERTAVAFVRAQVARGDYKSAAEWAQKITSPKWRGAVSWHMNEVHKNLPAAAAPPTN